MEKMRGRRKCGSTGTETRASKWSREITPSPSKKTRTMRCMRVDGTFNDCCVDCAVDADSDTVYEYRKDLIDATQTSLLQQYTFAHCVSLVVVPLWIVLKDSPAAFISHGVAHCLRAPSSQRTPEHGGRSRRSGMRRFSSLLDFP